MVRKHNGANEFDESTDDTRPPVTPWPKEEQDALAKWKRGRWVVNTIIWDGSPVVCGFLPAIVVGPWDVNSSKSKFTLYQMATPSSKDPDPIPGKDCLVHEYDFEWTAAKHTPTKSSTGKWGQSVWVPK